MVERARVGVLLVAAAIGVAARAQAPNPPEPSMPPSAAQADTPGPEAFAALAWLEGCWRGSVNQREFSERWEAPRGNGMSGASRMLFEGRTLSAERLRLEVRPDGVYYVAAAAAQPELAYRLVEQTTDTAEGRSDEIFTFANPEREFPRRIIYRRGREGWLYATVEGTVGGKPRQIIYPMRRVGCESGEPLGR